MALLPSPDTVGTVLADPATRIQTLDALERHEGPHDAALALRMKRAVCPNPEIDACSLDELPDDYAPLDPKSECSICQAVTADVFGIIHTSRERPKKKHGDKKRR